MSILPIIYGRNNNGKKEIEFKIEEAGGAGCGPSLAAVAKPGMPGVSP